MPRQLLFEYLERQQVYFRLQSHEQAFTAEEVAQSCHINDRTLAKVVMIKIKNELAMVVIPAHYLVDLEQLKISLNVEDIELAKELEFSHRFPRCEVGAIPPFGHLYGLQTYMVPVFEDGEEIAFNAGTHTQLVHMDLNDYIRLAHVIRVEEAVIASRQITESEEPFKEALVASA